MSVFNCHCSWSVTFCSKVLIDICLWSYDFNGARIFNLHTVCRWFWFSMVTVTFWWILGLRLNDFNFYVMGKKNMLSLQCAFLALGNRVESSKIRSYLELFWTKYFHFGWQNASTYFSRFVKTDWQIIHKFTDIKITEKRNEGIKPSDGEEFRIFKLKLA